MKTQYAVAVIGLGGIGQRMLTNMPNQGRLEIIGGWDQSAEARAAAKVKFPWLPIAESGEALIDNTKTDLVYIGVPPLAHRQYALAAIDAGKAVFCEKPLGIDVPDSRYLTERMEASGLKQAVNFVFGAARGAEMVRGAIDAGDTGKIVSAELHLHFAKWPRGWQENATWLSSAQGGRFHPRGRFAFSLSERETVWRIDAQIAFGYLPKKPGGGGGNSSSGAFSM